MKRKPSTLKSICFVSEKASDDEKDRTRRQICKQLPVKYKYNDNNYCVLHYPSKEKVKEFERVFKRKLSDEADNNFSWIWFPSKVDLSGIEFSTNTSFGFCHFSENVDFFNTTFLQSVSFFKTYFADEVSFIATEFKEEVNFSLCTFNGDTYFVGTKFWENVSFDGHFIGEDDCAIFLAKSDQIEFYETVFYKPDLVYFHSVKLQPSWFVDADIKNINFINIDWTDIDGKSFKIKEEFKILKEKGFLNSQRLLAITYRQLAENAENNHRFEEASNFRRMAFETEWLDKKEKFLNRIENLVVENEKLKNRFGGSTKEEDKANPPINFFGIFYRNNDFVIHGLYRITSFYGESWVQAASVLLILVFAVFPLLYKQYEFLTCPQVVTITRKLEDCQKGKLNWYQATEQSLGVASLQRIEHRKPIDESVGWLVFAETILVPLQAALLALAIRRKFMR